VGKETIIVLKNGTRVKFNPISMKIIEELAEFFADRDIPEEKIPLYLAILVRHKRSRKL